MKMRPPATPLITNDPYFNVWSMSDQLCGRDTFHWSGVPHKLTGMVVVDGKTYLFMGRNIGEPLKQKSFDMNLFTSEYVFENEIFELTVKFTTPLLIDDIEILCRPVSYIEANIHFGDSNKHECALKITVGDELCLDKQLESPTVYHIGAISGLKYATLENSVQNVLNKSGDDLRINWGTLLVASNDEKAVFECGRNVQPHRGESNRIHVTVPLCDSAVLAIAYDDVKGLVYFSKQLDSYWKVYDQDIKALTLKALRQYRTIAKRCCAFSDQIIADAKRVGGDDYADLLVLAWRQTLAAHKMVRTQDEEFIFVSKECFSNGDACTVDVTYPGAPMFLLYNPLLLKGLLLPIMEYAAGDSWKYDCAPHDMGVYPILNGQEYKDADGNIINMPVEECGNMIILTAAYVKASGDTAFALKYRKLLEKWVVYLLENGEDPENQLCTDDFAGRSAHNCNLALKAIMGIASFGLIQEMLEDKDTAEEYLTKAKKLAESWEKRAAKTDGTYKMTFDDENTFSLKYNMVWDVVFGTKLFNPAGIEKELNSYVLRKNRYGIPLDNRASYTKSDWILWCAAMCDNKDVFAKLVHAVWLAYDETAERVPMGDWYDTITGEMIIFRNRTVQGGMFFPLLRESGKIRFDF